MKIPALLPWLVAATTLAVPVRSAPAEDFAAAYQEGQRNEHDGAAGAAYINQLMKSLGPALAASAKQCGGAPADTAAHPQQLALQISSDGSVRQVLVGSGSAYWDCFRAALAKKTLPRPPRDAFWTSGTVQ
jgi:hypothetical protein